MEMREQDVRFLASQVLESFREAQSLRGNKGCRCHHCQEDMKEALKAVIEGGDFTIATSGKPPAQGDIDLAGITAVTRDVD